jgi:levanase
MIGWMNNWQYANQIPTSPWRSAMSVPREVALRTIDGRMQLVQEPVRALERLRSGPVQHVERRVLPEGVHTLSGKGARGRALEIEAELDPRTADHFGLKVRVGEGEETVIGYDAWSAELYVDRTRSGDSSFSRRFAGVQRAPLEAGRDGEIRLRVLVDWSSVEVFADRGQVTITDQVFPRASSDGVQVFARGGSVEVESLTVRPLRSAW